MLIVVLVAVLAVFGLVRPSQAGLNAVDPGPYVAGFGFFPQYYQDTHGIALDLCLSRAVGPNGAMCVLLADPGFNPALAISFPTNFPSESFWFVADALIATPAVPRLRFVAGLEAAFANGDVAPGDQISFARIRIVGTLATPGTYTVTHPYGQEVFEVSTVGNRAIALTRDIGVAPGIFTGALKGDIGPFLTRAGGLITVGTEQFIGDPNVTQAVVGSPFGTNFLRVQGPGGIDITQPLFTLAGKVSAVPLPTPLVIDRTSYSRNATQTQIDVFASAPPTATLNFDVTGAANVAMGGDAIGRFFGQALVPPASLSDVTIDAVHPPNTPTTSLPSPVTDVVFISKAEYSISTDTLVIEAFSSDETVPPTLSYGLAPLTPGALQSITVPGLTIPPAKVTVTSSAGGSDTEDVVILP
jgi:hypothetical protein